MKKLQRSGRPTFRLYMQEKVLLKIMFFFDESRVIEIGSLYLILSICNARVIKQWLLDRELCLYLLKILDSQIGNLT